MNYLIEIRLFYEWLETNDLSSSGIALWHGLMYIANRSGWRVELNIPLNTIILRTGLSRTTIYKERIELKRYGLIDFIINEGSQSGTYRIISFESRIVAALIPEPDDNIEGPSGFASVTRTQSGTQTGMQNDFVSATRTQTGTQSGNIYKHKLKQGSKKSGESSKEKIKTDDLAFIDDPGWREVIRPWLEFKKSNRQGYKSEMSIRKCLTMLKRISGGNPATATAIIDKSIAQNWAGLYELGKSGGHVTLVPATGQRIGQIKQPESQDRQNKILEKFTKK